MAIEMCPKATARARKLLVAMPFVPSRFLLLYFFSEAFKKITSKGFRKIFRVSVFGLLHLASQMGP